jgi:bla regulator protein blaR1
MIQTFFFLLNHLWQSTLVAGAAWLACGTMLKSNSPAVRFRVWLGACAKFLIPFAVLVEAGGRLSLRPVLTLAGSQHVFDLVRGGDGGLATAPFRLPRAPQSPEHSVESLLFAVTAAWAIGAAVVLFQWFGAWWTVRRAARDAIHLCDFRGFPVLESRIMRDQRIEPGLFGLWRPRILIPEGMATNLTSIEFEAVLSHEWNHARRHDNLAAALQMLAEVLFWFYPVIWIVGRKLAEERELACDEAVLAHSRPDEGEAYAEGILKVCKLYSSSTLPCAAGITGPNLRSRIDLILKNERSRPLDKRRRLVLGGVLLAAVIGPVIAGFLTAPAAFAQEGNSFVGLATSAEKKFEVATVKLNNSGGQGFQLGPPGRGSITIVNVPLRGIIVQSFRTQRNMVLGIPGWAETERYDIVGKGPDPTMTNPQVWEMMRSLLIERFHLKYHVENREMPVYALTIAPRGLKLTLGENGRCKQELKDGKPCGDILVPPFGTAMYNMPIGALITGIGARAGRPIIDKTGLTGKYDANIRWLPDGVKLEDLDLKDVPAEFRPDDIAVFQALEEQAGLKLVPERAGVPVVVIDSVSRPDPN